MNALSGFHPEMPRPSFGLSVWMMSDGETALAFVAADGTGALVGSDTDDVVFWDRRGERWDWPDLPASSVSFSGIYNVSESAESVLGMARRALADYRASLREEKDPADALYLRPVRTR